MSEVNVKIGTVVNGITIESHKAMQAKIAELLMENDKLKGQVKPEPDMVRIECVSCGEVHELCSLQTYKGGLHCAECLVRALENIKPDKAAQPIPTPREMIGVYKDENQIPDWIAPGKWVELVDMMGLIYHALIDYIKGDKVYYKKSIFHDDEHMKGYDSLEHVKTGKPFTPPPCPELPTNFSETYKGKITFGTVHLPLEAWIAAAKLTDASDLININLPQLESIRDWREKWGEG